MSGVGFGALILAAVAQTAYVAVLATVRWWRTRVGRSRMVKAASLALVLDAFVFNRLFDLAGWAWDVLALLLAVGCTYQFAVIVRERIAHD